MVTLHLNFCIIKHEQSCIPVGIALIRLKIKR